MGNCAQEEQIELGIWSHTGVTGLRRFLCTCVSERERDVSHLVCEIEAEEHD